MLMFLRMCHSLLDKVTMATTVVRLHMYSHKLTMCSQVCRLTSSSIPQHLRHRYTDLKTSFGLTNDLTCHVLVTRTLKQMNNMLNGYLSNTLDLSPLEHVHIIIKALKRQLKMHLKKHARIQRGAGGPDPPPPPP